jgi:hypothetical protein
LAQAELLRERSDFCRREALLSAALCRRPDAAGDFMLPRRSRAGMRRRLPVRARRLQPDAEGRQHYGSLRTGQDLPGERSRGSRAGIGDVVVRAYLLLLGEMGARVVFLPRTT